MHFGVFYRTLRSVFAFCLFSLTGFFTLFLGQVAIGALPFVPSESVDKALAELKLGNTESSPSAADSQSSSPIIAVTWFAFLIVNPPPTLSSLDLLQLLQSSCLSLSCLFPMAFLLTVFFLCDSRQARSFLSFFLSLVLF